MEWGLNELPVTIAGDWDAVIKNPSSQKLDMHWRVCTVGCMVAGGDTLQRRNRGHWQATEWLPCWCSPREEEEDVCSWVSASHALSVVYL
jgi:hypothetical protein